MAARTKCSDQSLLIYHNGIHVRKDTGCVGDSHTYTTSTTLPSDTTYKWYLDSVAPPSPLLGTQSSYTYTFDNETHSLFVVATSSEAQCAIQVDVDVIGSDCNICEVECQKETVKFPAGKFMGLVDIFGNIIKVPNGLIFECANPSARNHATVLWIKKMLKGKPHCQNADIQVNWSMSKTGYCLTMEILNSPMKFNRILIDNKYYNFDTNNC